MILFNPDEFVLISYVFFLAKLETLCPYFDYLLATKYLWLNTSPAHPRRAKVVLAAST